MDGEITWRPLSGADFPMLARWLAEPAVVRWWNHETSTEAVERDFGTTLRGEEPNEDLVAMLDGTPFGLAQRCRIADYPEDLAEFEALVQVPPDAMQIDYLIAGPEHRGRGLGTRMIESLIATTWRDHPAASGVMVAVVAANVASWRALEKAGMMRVATGDMEPDNPVDDPRHHVYAIERPG